MKLLERLEINKGAQSRYHGGKPEKNLFAAILATAIHDLKIESAREKSISWLLGEGATVSFSDCCEVLDLDPEAVLLAIREVGLLSSPILRTSHLVPQESPSLSQ